MWHMNLDGVLGWEAYKKTPQDNSRNVSGDLWKIHFLRCSSRTVVMWFRSQYPGVCRGGAPRVVGQRGAKQQGMVSAKAAWVYALLSP